VDLELRRFFKSLQTKSPFIDIQTEPALLEQTELSEFFHEGHENPGLGVGIAYLIEALAVSVPSAPHWQTAHIHLEYSFLDPDTTNLSREKVTVHHASEPQHLAIHHTWIQEQTCLQLWTTEDEIVPCYSNAAGDKLTAQWLTQLSDTQGQAIIINRLTNVKKGNLGDHKDFDGILELRIHYGCGYRIYCARIQGAQVVVLLAGRKLDQKRDLVKAKKILQELTIQN
jgi:putative addiction module killer protein